MPYSRNGVIYPNNTIVVFCDNSIAKRFSLNSSSQLYEEIATWHLELEEQFRITSNIDGAMSLFFGNSDRTLLKVVLIFESGAITLPPISVAPDF